MALPADGLTTLSDAVTIGNSISTLIAPAFKNKTVGLNLTHTENCSTDSNVIKFRLDGFVIAEAVSEGAVYTPSDTNSDITITSVTATATKVAVSSPLTVEAQRFGAGSVNVPKTARAQGEALARKFDADLFALFDSVTNAATATSTFDTDTALLAQYYIDNAETPPGSKVAVISVKQALELKKLIANSGAAQYSNPSQINLIQGSAQANGFIGNFLDTDWYQVKSSNLSTSGGDTQGAMWQAPYGFAAALGGDVETRLWFSGHGIANQIPGFADMVSSYWLYNVVLFCDAAVCELRSDS